MREIKIIVAPNLDLSNDELDFIISDIANSMVNILNLNKFLVSSQQGGIQFDSDLSEVEVKKRLKDVFSHHFDDVRFNGIVSV